MLPALEHCGYLRANAPMNAFLNRLLEIDHPAHDKLLVPFNRLLKKGFLNRGGAITLKYFDKSSGKSHRAVDTRLLKELTGYEHALNRLHVEDFVPRGRERYHLTLLRHSLALGDEVIRRIKAIAPKQKVQVTLCFDENLRRGICVFSFHLRRKGQELWQDVEGYRQPCLIMET